MLLSVTQGFFAGRCLPRMLLAVSVTGYGYIDTFNVGVVCGGGIGGGGVLLLFLKLPIFAA